MWVSWQIWGDQRTTLGSWSSLSTVCVLGIELRSSGWGQVPLLMSLLAVPSPESLSEDPQFLL